MKFDVGEKTDKGRRRPKNEDALYVDRNKGLFVVADGLGGHLGGEVASKMCVEEIVGFFSEIESKAISENRLKEAIEQANASIYARSLTDGSLRGMGTTVVLSLMRDGILWLAHVGDSRAYFLTENGFRQLTEDHAMPPPFASLLRAVGVDETVEVDTSQLAYSEEALLLCTDGLTNMLSDEEIEEIMRSHRESQTVCDSLVDAANQRGGMDNITVVVIGEAK